MAECEFGNQTALGLTTLLVAAKPYSAVETVKLRTPRLDEVVLGFGNLVRFVVLGIDMARL